MRINQSLDTIRSNLNRLIDAIDSNSLEEHELATRMRTIFDSLPSFCGDPTIMELFNKLEVSLELHGLKDASQKVHRLVVSRKNSEQPIADFSKAFESFQENMESRSESPSAPALLKALKNLSGWENHLETRFSLLKLKSLLTEREKQSKARTPWALRLLDSLYSSEPYLLGLLQKSPKRFGLTEAQVQETIHMAIGDGAEGIKLLLVNQKSLVEAGASQPLLQSKTIGAIRTMLKTGPEIIDAIIDCMEDVEVHLHRQVRVKEIKPLSKQEVDRFYQIFANHETSYIEQHADDLGFTKEEKNWIASSVEIEGLPIDISFLVSKRFLEKGNCQTDLHKMTWEMATIKISEYSHIDDPKLSYAKLKDQAGEWASDNSNISGGLYTHTISRHRFSLSAQQAFQLALAAQGSTILNIAGLCNPTRFTQDELFTFTKLIRTKAASSCREESYKWGIKDIESQERRIELLKMGIAQNPELFAGMNCDVFFKVSKEEVLDKDPSLQLFFSEGKELPEMPSLQEPIKTMVSKLKEKKELERAILGKWLGYVLICLEKNASLDLGKEGAILLQKLEGLRPPSLRYRVTKYLWLVLENPSLKSTLESKEAKELFSQKFTPLFKLVLTPILQEKGLIIRLIDMLNFDYYNDADRRRIALHALLDLVENTSLTNIEKASALQAVIPREEKLAVEIEEASLQEAKKKASKAELDAIQKRQTSLRAQKHKCALLLNQNLQMMECFINLNRLGTLRNAKTPEDLTKELKEMFVEVTGVQTENIKEKYLQTFAKSRNPHAIFIYAGKLNQLPKEEKPLAAVALKIYVESVLDGTFAEKRYKEISGDHLSTVFKGRTQLKELWMQGEKMNYLSLMPDSSDSVSSSFDVHEFLRRSICLDHHIDPAALPFLNSYLQTVDMGKLQELDTALSLESDPSKRNMLLLEKGLFLLLDESKTQEEKAGIFTSHVKDLMDLRGLTDPFKADLRDLETALSTKKKASLVSEWTAVDTDHWEDLLLCGAEVLGSCQNINGHQYLNKCLLGYLLDGKNRMIAVKDESGKLVARSIFRLLWDNKEKTPVLFLERIYTAAGAPSHATEALKKMALRRSEALGIPLSSEDNLYHNNLESLGSKAPFEYVDAGAGSTNGQYTIYGKPEI